MRKINVLKADGTIGPMDEFTVDNYYHDEYKVPTPNNELEAEKIRGAIAEKYDNKPKKLTCDLI